MLTTKGMKFSGYGKKPTKQGGIQRLDFFAFFFFTAFLRFFFFPTVLCAPSRVSTASRLFPSFL